MGQIAYATVLKYDVDHVAAPTAFTALLTAGDLKSFGAVEQEVQKVKITGIDQATNIENYIPGLVEGGELEIEAWWVGATFATVKALRGTTHNFRIVVPGTSAINYTWTGFVNKVSSPMANDASDALTYKFTVCIVSDLAIT